MKRGDAKSVEWVVTPGLTPYADALAAMETRAKSIADGMADEQVWLVEHAPVYTLGVSSNPSDVRNAHIPAIFTNRGGQVTYHGPGQRVAYVMLDLNARTKDVRAFVAALEDWVIATLNAFDVHGLRKPGRIGVWVNLPDGREAKIAALGVKVRRWVSFHGVSINVNPDLSHFDGIVPCGITEHGVTSLAALGLDMTMAELDTALRTEFEHIFGSQTQRLSS